MTESLLQVFGLTASKAHQLCTRSLPDVGGGQDVSNPVTRCGDQPQYASARVAAPALEVTTDSSSPIWRRPSNAVASGSVCSIVVIQ